jgi:hypothetical protein
MGLPKSRPEASSVKAKRSLIRLDAMMKLPLICCWVTAAWETAVVSPARAVTEPGLGLVEEAEEVLQVRHPEVLLQVLHGRRAPEAVVIPAGCASSWCLLLVGRHIG